MPELTRTRDRQARGEKWLIFYSGVRVGSIGERAGNPVGTDQWEWRSGFYPGCDPGEDRSGTAATYDQARAGFEKAWGILLSKKTQADFQAWRDDAAWTAEKYRRFDRGERMPPDWQPAHG